MKFRRYAILDSNSNCIIQNKDLVELIREALNKELNMKEFKIRALYVDDNFNRHYIKI